MLLVIRILTGRQLRKLYTLFLLGCLIGGQAAHSQCLSVRSSGRVFQLKNKQGNIEIKNPENILAADNKYATARSLVSIGVGSEAPSDEIEIKDFGFSIPEPAVICGIEVRIKRRADAFLGISIGSAGPRDRQVMLLKNGNTTGVNTAKQSFWGDDNIYSSYGGSNGMWGTTLTTTEVNNPNFGVSFSVSFASIINVSVVPSAEIDHVEMVVYYQPTVVLPIQLQEFRASVLNNKVQLNWALSNQETGASVHIQRSNDAATWTTIKELPVLNNTFTAQQYEHSDFPQESGIDSYRYRLKILSANGTAHYSKEIPVKWPGTVLRPFFIKKGKDLIIQRPTNNSPIRLFDSNGSLLHTSIHTEAQHTVISVGHLPEGLYFLRVGEHVQKFLNQ